MQVAVGHLTTDGEHVGQLELRLARPARDILATGAPARLVELITGWPEDIVDLEIVEGVVSSSLLIPGGARPVVDAERVRDLVGRLRVVFGSAAAGRDPVSMSRRASWAHLSSRHDERRQAQPSRPMGSASVSA